MKIALLASAKSEVTVKWANMFRKRVNEVTVFSLPEDKPQESDFADGINVNYLELSAAEGGLKKNAKYLKELIRSGNYDVVNAIGAATYGYIATLMKIPYLLTVTGPDLFAYEDKTAKAEVKKTVFGAAAICCPSAVAMQRCMAILKKKKKEFFIAAPGIDLDMFRCEPDKAADKVVFGCIKPLEAESNIEALLEAYREMKDKVETETKLVIIGTGSRENELRKKAIALGIEEDVEFRGHVKHGDMPAAINSFNALCNTAKREMFGIPTLEGMACGVPTIATDTEGSSEIILNGVTGYTVKIGKTSNFAYRMTEFAKYPANAEKIGSKTRQDIEEYFDINKGTDTYIKALEFVRKAQ